MKILVALAAVLAALTFATVGQAAGTMNTCGYKKGEILMTFGNVSNAACAAFNQGFHGKRFYGHFGKARCGWVKDSYAAALFTRDALTGKIACRVLAPSMKRDGWIRAL